MIIRRRTVTIKIIMPPEKKDHKVMSLLWAIMTEVLDMNKITHHTSTFLGATPKTKESTIYLNLLLSPPNLAGLIRLSIDKEKHMHS